jgi:hypothetical protein
VWELVVLHIYFYMFGKFWCMLGIGAHGGLNIEHSIPFHQGSNSSYHFLELIVKMNMALND